MVPALGRFLFGAYPSAVPAAAAGGGGGKAIGSRADRASFEDSVLFAVFSSNAIGILCARSMHYQFYSW